MLPVIYFVDSRNCEALRNNLYNSLSRLLSRSYTVENLPGPGFKYLDEITSSSQASRIAVIIGGPRELLTNEDITSIHKFFLRGGNVLYLAPFSGSYDVTISGETNDDTDPSLPESEILNNAYDPIVASVTAHNVSVLTNNTIEYNGSHTIMSSIFHQDLLHPRNALINNCTLPGFTARLLELRRCSRLLNAKNNGLDNESYTQGLSDSNINYDFDVYSRSSYMEAMNNKSSDSNNNSNEQDIVLHLTGAALSSVSNGGKTDTNINIVIPHASSFTVKTSQNINQQTNNSNNNNIGIKINPITLIATGDTCIPTNQPIMVAAMSADTHSNGGVMLFAASTLIFSNLWLSKLDNQYLALTIFEHIFGLNETILGPVNLTSDNTENKDKIKNITFKPQTKFLMTLSNPDIVKTSLEITDKYVLLPNIANTSSRLRACLHNPDILPDDFRMLLSTSAPIDLPTMSSVSSVSTGSTGQSNIISNITGGLSMQSRFDSVKESIQSLFDGDLSCMDSPADIKKVLLPHILELYKKLNIPNCDKEPNLKMVMPSFERSMPSLQTAVHMPGLPNPIGEPQLELFDLDAEFASPTVKLQKMAGLAQKAQSRKIQKAMFDQGISEEAAKTQIGGVTEDEFINLVRQVGEIVGIKSRVGSKPVEAKNILAEMLKTVVEFKKSSFQDPNTFPKF